MTTLLLRQRSSSRRTALQSRPDGSGEPSYGTYFRAGIIPVRRLLSALIVLMALAMPVSAQLAPEAGYIFPAGGRAGTTVEVKLGGYDWTPDMQFFVQDPRIKLEVLGPPGELHIPPPPYW